MKNQKNVTIHDLAEKLNVSASTISRALNNHPSIGKKTKAAVKNLAEKWGYRPNHIAASLRTKNSRTIGIMVSWINRPFISSLISGIEKAASEAGYQVLITQSHDELALEKENLKTLYNSRIAALIVSLSMETEDYDHFSMFREGRVPIVFVDRIPNSKNIQKVQIDNFKAAFEATEHLIEQGCKRIAHFGGSRNQLIYEDRRMGYVAALMKHKFEIDESLIKEGATLNAEEGFKLAEELLSSSNPPDGIFTANDTSGVSAIKYATQNGIKVPEELAIIGFNDDPICQIVEPQLSSVHHPAMDMGAKAIEQALIMLKEDSNEESSNGIILDTHVIARESSTILKD